MFRTVGDQVSLWEWVLPAELLKCPAELSRVDELLDDEAFFAPQTALKSWRAAGEGHCPATVAG